MADGLNITGFSTVTGGSASYEAFDKEAPAAEHTLKVDCEQNGLIIAAGWVRDDRLAGVSTKSETFRIISPPFAEIDVRNVKAPVVGAVHSAVPYGIRSESELLLERAAPSTARGTVITTIMPAILGRVALYVPHETESAIDVTFNSATDEGKEALARVQAESLSMNHTVGANETLRRMSWAIDPRPPFIDVWSNHARVEMDVVEGDVLVFAASDTSPNAASISVNILDSFDTDPQLNHVHNATINNFTVGTLLRVDFVEQTGRIKIDFNDVTGAIQVLRLTPSETVTLGTAYPTISEPLAYFEIDYKRNDRLDFIYPDWLKALLKNQRHTGKIGIVESFPRHVDVWDQDGIPRLWNEKAIMSIQKDELTNINIPFGSALPFADVNEMENRMETLRLYT